MSDADFIAMIKTFGPVVAVLAFALIWLKQDTQRRELRDAEREQNREARDKDREERMGKRLDEMTRLHHETFSNVVLSNTEMMGKATVALERSAIAMESMAKASEHCPRRNERGSESCLTA